MSSVGLPRGTKIRGPFEFKIMGSSVTLVKPLRLTITTLKSVPYFETENFGTDGVRSERPWAAKACISVASAPVAINPIRLGVNAGCFKYSVTSDNLKWRLLARPEMRSEDCARSIDQAP